MNSRNVKLMVSLGVCAGLLALLLGLLLMAPPVLLSGLALLLGLAAWGLRSRHKIPTCQALRRCLARGGRFLTRPLRPPRERPVSRSSYSRGYRLAAALMIAAMLAGMAPAPGLHGTPRTAHAAAASGGATPSGAGQATIAGPPGVTVNLHNGNLLYRRTDLASPAGGYTFLALHSSLSYNSLLVSPDASSQDRGFGPG